MYNKKSQISRGRNSPLPNSAQSSRKMIWTVCAFCVTMALFVLMYELLGPLGPIPFPPPSPTPTPTTQPQSQPEIELNYLNNSVIFLTGIVGFIGFHTTKEILTNENFHNITIIGFDNFDGSNPYYPGQLKEERFKVLQSLILSRNNKLTIIKGNLDNRTEIEGALGLDRSINNKFTHILHLAAQAGVRYSSENPYVYAKSNVNGFLNLLEYIARTNPNIPIVYASSSSVYGMSGLSRSNEAEARKDGSKVDLNNVQINSENDLGIMPESVYAATKKSDELLSWTYHKLYNMNFIGLRFFTVYGSYGRPDMAYMIFAKNMFLDKPIKLFNNGNMKRDFTHVSDIVNGIIRSLNYIKYNTDNFEESNVWEIMNLGNGNPRLVMDLVNILKDSFSNQNYNRIEKVNNKPNGDVFTTYANVTKANVLLGYKPNISLEEGIKQFAQWFEKDRNDPNSQFVKTYINM